MTSYTRLRHRTLALVLALTYASLITQLPLTSHAVEVRKIEAAKLDRKTATLESQKLMNALGKTPISFEANQGQAQRDVKFLARGSSYSALLGTKEAVLQLESRTPTKDHSPVDRQAMQKSKQQARVRMKFVGANANARVFGQNEIAGKSNYFIGKDPKQWRTGVTNYSKVRYQEIYQGVDLVFYSQDQDLEYDFMVAPGADPKQIRLEFKGADKVSIDAQGDLVLQTSPGEMRHRKPSIHQQVNGERQAVEGRYTLRGKRQIGFELANYDRTKELVIDPVIVYSTLLGGTAGPDIGAWAHGIATYEATDGKAYAYVVGITTNVDFPVKNAFQSTYAGRGPMNWTGDVFVSKLDMSASGTASLIYSTYLGGSHNENGAAIGVDSAGNAYVTGATSSPDFPIWKAGQPTFAASPNQFHSDAFVTALSADGSSLVYSTYLGGSSHDFGLGIAVDSDGSAYIKGKTRSTNFPLVNAYQSTNNRASGLGVYFISKIVPPFGLNPSALVYSTLLDAGDFINAPDEVGNGIAVDSAGKAYVTGTTTDPNFPVLNGFQTDLKCTLGNAFVVKLNPSASGPASLEYSTFLGGTCGSYVVSGDGGRAIATDAAGAVYVTGLAVTVDFPTTAGAFSVPQNGFPTPGVFVTKIDPVLSGSSSLIYSTVFGGFDGAMGTGIAVDSQGNAFIAGETGSFDFPLVNPLQSFSNGVFQSINGGDSWSKLSNGLSAPMVSALAVDTSTSPRILYAGTPTYGPYPGGIYKSTDGGLNWNAANSGLTNTDVRALALSPTSPSIIYAATGGGVFKTTDAGVTWNSLSSGLSATAITSVTDLVFDPTTSPATLYAPAADNLYKLNDGSTTWNPTGFGAGLYSVTVDSSTSPGTLYAEAFDLFHAHRSVDGGATWIDAQVNNGGYDQAGPITADPTTTPKTLYRADPYGDNLLKSVDEGNTWQQLTHLSGSVTRKFVVDTTTTPSTLYLVDGDSPVGLRRSTDGGITWTMVHTRGVGAFVIDTTTATASTPTTLFIGTRYPTPDAFVAKLNSTGSALLFSSYLGDHGSDFAYGIALDLSGNIYVAGKTELGSFPTVNAFQAGRAGNYPFPIDAFALKLGSVSLPTTSATHVTTEVVVQNGTLELDFPNITGSTTGNPPVTTVDPLSSTATANLTLSNNLGAYDIKTTATVNTSGYATDPTQGIKLTFTVPVVNDESVFNALVITHGEDQNADGIIQPNEMIPYNGTVDPNKVTGHDFATRTVWVYVPSLSPFVIVKGVGDQIADLIRLVDSFNLKAGIENSLDKKLENALKAYQAAQAKQRATACNVMGAFINETQAQTNKAITQSQADQLITAANQINVVLGCR